MPSDNLKPTSFYENRAIETQKPAAIPSSSAIDGNRKSNSYRITMWVLWGLIGFTLLMLVGAVLNGSAGAGWATVALTLQLFSLLFMVLIAYVIQRALSQKK